MSEARNLTIAKGMDNNSFTWRPSWSTSMGKTSCEQRKERKEGNKLLEQKKITKKTDVAQDVCDSDMIVKPET